MNRVQRTPLLRRVDDAGDVPLRRPLCDRADVDVLASERVEHLSGDAGPPFHPFADDGEDRLILLPIDAHQLLVHLEPEVLVDRRDRAVGVGGPDAEADRVLG